MERKARQVSPVTMGRTEPQAHPVPQATTAKTALPGLLARLAPPDHLARMAPLEPTARPDPSDQQVPPALRELPVRLAQ